ncbi:UNVERIFIED_CONTAM: Actin-binding LIM protein 2 [Gekko kuhli]
MWPSQLDPKGKQRFPPGDRVTFNGKECICQKCSLPPAGSNGGFSVQALQNCGGCGSEIKNGQSLVALEKHWHLTCFKCKICGKVLNAEYISKDGVPYCETDYHVKFGIRCDSCEKYIMGRVLEAGEKHYHPTCARCLKCHQMFAEGEEMYLQGTSILHPACRQAARVEEKTKAKLGDEIIDYRDLAALPKDKAIYNIDRPDMISYSPYISYSSEDRRSYGEGDQDDRPFKHYRTSSPSSAGSLGYGCNTPPCHSPQSYSRPGVLETVGQPTAKGRQSCAAAVGGALHWEALGSKTATSGGARDHLEEARLKRDSTGEEAKSEEHCTGGEAQEDTLRSLAHASRARSQSEAVADPLHASVVRVCLRHLVEQHGA